METTRVETTVYSNEWLAIESCPHCAGTGVCEKEELTNYHKGDYTTFYYECKQCEGVGRRLKKTVSIHGTVNLPGSRENIPYDKKIDTYESMKNLTIHDVYRISK